VTYGRNYDGTTVSEYTAREGYEAPFMFWVSSIAVRLAFCSRVLQGLIR
jgi:hypothetical protein